MKIKRRLLTQEEMQKREMNSLIGGSNINSASHCECDGSTNSLASDCNDNTNKADYCHCKGNNSNLNSLYSCSCS